MKTLRWTIASSLVGVLFAGTAMAQTVMSSPVQQPGLIRQMGFQSDEYGYAVADPSPAPAGAAATPASPSNMPPAPPAAKAEDKKEAEKPKEEEKKEEEKKDEDKPAEEGPYKIFHQGCLGEWEDCHHLDIRGFIDVGAGLNPDSPLNRYNGPVGYDDRSNELQLNQLYLTAERLTKVENDCGMDYGYRMDLLYGTDRRFVQTVPGSEWDSAWDNGNRFYGLAMPQLYGQFQINKLTLEGGHFFAPCGLEVVNADGNFFYSHSYGFLYGMPTTLTGGYATYKLKDKLLVNVGVDTGWNEFTAINGKPNYMFGVNWTSADKDGKLNVTSECFVGNTQTTGPGINDSTRVMFCTDINLKLGDKWTYTLENNVAHDSETGLASGGFGPASWTGWTNYLFYNINDCWGFGIRYEYFEDLDGAVVAEDLTGSPITTSTLAPGSKWQDFTMGLNWKPNKNVTCRSEVRWDSAQNGAAVGARPFDDGQKNTQFLWGNDIIIRF
jgi:hypothetical protein